MKRAPVFLILLCLAALPLGCAGKPTPQPTSDPDAALLIGRWEQFIPVSSLPQSLALDASGSATVDDLNGKWMTGGGTLTIRLGGEEDAYSYTVSGYMLTLTSPSTGDSDFYINPEAFASGADGNAQLSGQWAAFSTFAMMRFDGAGGMDDIVYTTAGRTELPRKYAARDGILQTWDAGGNYTYNLFSMSPEGALLLADTTEYDNRERQWTAYWKKTEPAPGFLANWAMAFDTQPGDSGFPAKLTLSGSGQGSAVPQGASEANIRWEYYNGGFAVLILSDTNLQYAWCAQEGGALSLGNPDVDEAWYYDATRYKPGIEALKEFSGTWKAEDTAMALDIQSTGTVKAVNDDGTKTALSAAAADGLMKLVKGGSTYYIAYSVDGDTMKIYYGNVPFFGAKEMPVSLVKQ